MQRYQSIFAAYHAVIIHNQKGNAIKLYQLPISKSTEICIHVFAARQQWAAIRHVNEYPTIHYFGNPGHTQSMIAHMISTEYPRSLNTSLHLIISDFARRRQSLKSKCSQIITYMGVCIQFNTKHRPEWSSISRVVLSR